MVTGLEPLIDAPSGPAGALRAYCSPAWAKSRGLRDGDVWEGCVVVVVHPPLDTRDWFAGEPLPLPRNRALTTGPAAQRWEVVFGVAFLNTCLSAAIAATLADSRRIIDDSFDMWTEPDGTLHAEWIKLQPPQPYFVVRIPLTETQATYQEAVAAIERRYVGMPVCEATKVALTNDAWALVRRIYADGNYLADRAGEPILSVDEVGVAIAFGESVSVTAYRQAGPPMTDQASAQFAIQIEATKISDRIADLRNEIEVERAKLRVVQTRCRHPRRYETCTMGDSGWRCPDCDGGR